MQEYRKNILKKSIAFLMLAIVMMLTVNKVLYIHTHQLSDGTIVVHSHPYNKTDDNQPIKSHYHSKFEFVFLQNLYILFSFFFLALSIGIILKTELVFNSENQKEIAHCILKRKSRAPPIF